jgi:hypothetical protein
MYGKEYICLDIYPRQRQAQGTFKYFTATIAEDNVSDISLRQRRQLEASRIEVLVLGWRGLKAEIPKRNSAVATDRTPCLVQYISLAFDHVLATQQPIPHTPCCATGA